MLHFLNDAVRAAIAFASDIASIASLALTLLVYSNVRKLRRAYLRELPSTLDFRERMRTSTSANKTWI
jgi:hypothetical protein